MVGGFALTRSLTSQTEDLFQLAVSDVRWCVAVKGFPANAKFAGKGRFLFTGCNPCAKLRDALRGQEKREMTLF